MSDLMKMEKIGFQNWGTEEAGELKIGDRIAIILAKRGMSQRELANKIHSTEVSVSRYINNTRVPKATILAEIAKALDVSMDVLFGIVPKKTGCTDCIKHGGDWECDHVNCHKGKNVSNDAISRKQAIKAMGEPPFVWTEDDEYAQGQLNMWEAAVEALRELPPVVSADLIRLQKEQAYMQGYEDGRKPRNGLWIDIKHTFMTKCSVCDWINNDDSSYNFCPNCGSYNGGE